MYRYVPLYVPLHQGNICASVVPLCTSMYHPMYPDTKGTYLPSMYTLCTRMYLPMYPYTRCTYVPPMHPCASPMYHVNFVRNGGVCEKWHFVNAGRIDVCVCFTRDSANLPGADGQVLALRVDFSAFASRGRSVARSLGRSVARSIGRSVARSLDRSIARSLDRSIARSLARSLDCSVARLEFMSRLNCLTPGLRKYFHVQVTV